MSDNFNKNLAQSYLDLYIQGYRQGYRDCENDSKRRKELDALKSITKEDIERIVQKSTKSHENI